jgi:energy-coupling factor transporter ATP-binding protein EcfA2
MSELLLIEDLELKYGKRILCGPINCSFTQGKINLVVGRAGAGKSTLLKMIAGFHNDYSGSVKLGGEKFNPSGNIALAFQSPENLFFNPTVNEEVCYALRQKKSLVDTEIEEFGKKWLKTWGLDPEKFWHKHPMELSGGEKRKVALSACTVLQPPVMMLDEPLAGLDHNGRKLLIKILRSLALEHIVVLVTHDPEQLLGYAGSVLFLRGNDCGFYTPYRFVEMALADPEFYPLPDWYVDSLSQKPYSERLPLINARAVAAFLNGDNDNAYYLSAG